MSVMDHVPVTPESLILNVDKLYNKLYNIMYRKELVLCWPRTLQQ